MRQLLRQEGARQLGRPVEDTVAEQGFAVSYTHLRAHETVLDLVCRLLLEKKKKKEKKRRQKIKKNLNILYTHNNRILYMCKHHVTNAINIVRTHIRTTT